MRVADRATARNYLKYLNKARNDYAATNERIASGNRFVKISDDVSSGSRVLQAKADKYKTEKHLGNVKNINDELKTTESALQSIEDTLVDSHTTLVAAISGDKFQNEASRKALIAEFEGKQKQILTFLNSKYGGKYVLGGTSYAVAPFSVDKENKLLYNGIPIDDVQKDDSGYFYTDANDIRKDIPMDSDIYMDIGLGIKMSGSNVDPTTGVKVSYSGLDIVGFGTDEDGNSVNFYNTYTDMINKMKEVDQDGASATADRLMKQRDSFSTALTDIGAKTDFLNTMEERLDASVDSYSFKIQNLMGTDDAEEATNQSMNDYVLKAVIQMGARILPVSLMDYLR